MSDVEGVDAGKEDKLKEIWGEDKLGRKADADYLICFLTKRMEENEESYVLNIDAAWGGGKSFFLERFGQQLEAENYLVTHVNAWTDDHIDDPQIAVMAAIEAKIDEALGGDDPLRKDWGNVKKYTLPTVGALASAAETVIGSPMDKGLETFKRLMENATRAIDIVVQEKKAVDNFKKAFSTFLAKLDENRKLPFLILIDEMDRCRPPYAIALLERVKHLFDIDNVVFVFATDTEQLSHSIGAAYGAGFEGRKYLQRFFKQTYLFEEPKLEEYVEFLVAKNQLDTANILWDYSDERSTSFHLTVCFQAFGLDLRSVEQCIALLKNIATAWEFSNVPIKGILLLPMIIAHQQQWEKIDNVPDDLRQRDQGTWQRLNRWEVVTPEGRMNWAELWKLYKSVLYDAKEANGLSILRGQRQDELQVGNYRENEKLLYDLWIIEQLQLEQSILPEKVLVDRKSIIEAYPEIVRSAGRFAQLDP